MPSLTRAIFDRLTMPGSRLPWIRDWLLGEVWTPGRYETLGALEYLQQGERQVNDLEEMLSTAAPRVYDELLGQPASDRSLRAFLIERRPCAAVILDGLSIREVPMILRLAEEGRIQVEEIGVTTAATPSETIDFIDQRLGIGRIGPSQLSTRQELREAGIGANYYDHEGRRHALSPDCPALCLWSAFPDQTYQDSGARFASHFVELQRRLEAVWRNAVQSVPGDRTILVTSDHGYVFFGHGCSAHRDNPTVRPLTEWFGGERWRKLEIGEDPPDHPDIHFVPSQKVAMIRGRVQTHPPGPASSRLYKHGGLSLMEMLTPWIVLHS